MNWLICIVFTITSLSVFFILRKKISVFSSTDEKILILYLILFIFPIIATTILYRRNLTVETNSLLLEKQRFCTEIKIARELPYLNIERVELKYRVIKFNKNLEKMKKDNFWWYPLFPREVLETKPINVSSMFIGDASNRQHIRGCE